MSTNNREDERRRDATGGEKQEGIIIKLRKLMSKQKNYMRKLFRKANNKQSKTKNNYNYYYPLYPCTHNYQIYFIIIKVNYRFNYKI